MPKKFLVIALPLLAIGLFVLLRRNRAPKPVKPTLPTKPTIPTKPTLQPEG